MNLLTPMRYLKESTKKRLKHLRNKSFRFRFNINRFTTINIETCSLCQLKCPYCPTGMRLRLDDAPAGMLRLDSLKSICSNSLKNYHGRIGLYNWGEPFLNPELPAIVRHLKENTQARLAFSSNFSWSDDARLNEVLGYLNKDAITISCDGFSQEICEKYRVNVDFDKVMHNVEYMVEHKHPQTRLLWQYLRFPWSMDEIDAAKKYCAAKNIEFYTGLGGMTADYPMLPTPHTKDEGVFKCDFFLDSLVINFDGEVYPCCAFYGPRRYSLGNAEQESLETIFTRGKGMEMLRYLAGKTSCDGDLFCKLCLERNAEALKSWKRAA